MRSALTAAGVLTIALASGCKSNPQPMFTPPGRIEVAVTVDDLPRHGEAVPGLSRVDLIKQMLEVLQRHHVPEVYGFVNGAKLTEHPEDKPALAAWVASAYPLGNHTYTHLDAAKASVDDFLANVLANESVLAEMMGPGPAREKAWKVLRFPYLHEGQDLAGRARIRQALLARGYRIAEVTIDFEDWAWNGPYARCWGKADSRALGLLTASYLEASEAALRWSDDTAKRLFGRPIRHILLLHVGAFDAKMLEGLLTLYEGLGVRWVPLDAALADPVYQEEPNPPKSVGGPLLWQVLKSRDWVGFPLPTDPEGLLTLICQ